MVRETAIAVGGLVAGTALVGAGAAAIGRADKQADAEFKTSAKVGAGVAAALGLACAAIAITGRAETLWGDRGIVALEGALLLGASGGYMGGRYL